MKFRKAQADSTTLIVVAAGALLAVAAVFGILAFTGFFSPLKPVKVGGVTIAQVPKEAVIEWVNETQSKRINDVYKKYGRLITETGESAINYEAARVDAIGKLAERLKVFVERFTEYAKAGLANSATTINGKKKKEAVEKISTEVSRMVQKMITRTNVVGAVEIVHYRMNGQYYTIVLLDPESIYQAIKAQEDVIQELAKKYGAQSEAVFDATRKALDEAYKGTPLENK